jgi:hypothetical protein
MISAVERSTPPAGLFDTFNHWMQSAFERKPPTWTTQHKVTRVWPIARLRDFSLSPESNVVPVLVLRPQTGHDSCISTSLLCKARSKLFNRPESAEWLPCIGSVQPRNKEYDCRGLPVRDIRSD